MDDMVINEYDNLSIPNELVLEVQKLLNLFIQYPEVWNQDFIESQIEKKLHEIAKIENEGNWKEGNTDGASNTRELFSLCALSLRVYQMQIGDLFMGVQESLMSHIQPGNNHLEVAKRCMQLFLQNESEAVKVAMERVKKFTDRTLSDVEMNRSQLLGKITTFWNNYLDFKRLPEKGQTVVIPHNTGDIARNLAPSNLPENEFFIFEHSSAGRVISVHEKYLKEVEEFVSSDGYNYDGLKEVFERLTQGKTKILGPVVSLYLFSDEKLLSENPYVSEIGDNDTEVYDEFMKSCVDGEEKEVHMVFGDPTHKFFVLRKGVDVVSLCNYSIDASTGIAHIGIITPKRYQGNGYGKALVNSVVHDILKNGLIPQYRADRTNIASNRIAESLGFTQVLESYSFVAE